GRTSVDLGGSTVVIAGGGGGGGGAHNPPPAGGGGGGGFAGIGAGTVAVGSNGTTGVDAGATANGGAGGQAAAGGAGGTNTANAALNGAAGTGIGVGTGGNGGPDADYDSGGGGAGGYTGGGGGAATIDSGVTGAGGGGGSSWVSATSPLGTPTAPTAISGTAGTASPLVSGSGVTGSIAIDWLPCLYGLSITKSASSPTVNAGDAVTWTVTVTNTGPDAMTRGDTVTLADTLPAGPNGAPTPAFEVTSIGVSGGANAELSRGAVTCTGVSVGASMPASTVCSRAYSAPGAPQAPTGGTRGLDPGETLTITYEQVIANTAPCATITNTATVTDRATQTGGADSVGVTATQSAIEPLAIGCYNLAITKVASPKPGVRPGGTVTWTVTVVNNGPADMEGPVDTDPNPLVVDDAFSSTGVGPPTLVSSVGPAGVCTRTGTTTTCPAGLPAGGTQVLTFTQLVGAGTADGTDITNTASLTDTATGDNDDSATDQTTVRDVGLTLAKSASAPTFAAVGDVIDYDYLVTNSGNLALSGPFTVADDQVSVTCPATATLAPAASITCTASTTITQADLDAGSVTNIASATNGTVTSPTDTVTITAAQGPALTLAKTASPATFAAVGDVITYQYLVTNTGNVSLAGPFTVADDKVTVTCPATASLDPGESITCTATATITQADIDAGTVTNVASASSGQLTSNDDGVSVVLAGTATPTPTLRPTIPPTDVTPVAPPPSNALGWLMAASLLVAALVALGGVVAARRVPARGRPRRN
ncbi:MAG TPA: hypothetical protein VFY18_10065, partial [Candidatus Limnocylindrales bacterium]|nr:hypothetical protein [Candidatus Limnocylindrales bacterium]